MALAAVLACGAAVASSQAQGPPASQTAKPREDQKAPQKRRRVVSDLSGFELLDAAKLKKKPMVTGAGRGLLEARPPVPLAPYLTRLYGTSPVFRWQAGGKGRFSFVLSDAAHKELHRAETVGDSYPWPAGAPRLGDGQTYYWKVEAVPSTETSPSSPCGVQVVTSQQRVEINRKLKAGATTDRYQAGLARAQVFTDQRLWYDAIGAYTELIASFPDRAEAYEKRGVIYAQIPVTLALAEADFARADELTGN
jgi:hypothetical protein